MVSGGDPAGERTQRDDFTDDLRPPERTGLDVGPPRWEALGYQTAYDLKVVHRTMPALPDDDLKRIPVVPDGVRLEQGETYVDLEDLATPPFRATAGRTAEAGRAYVPKSEIDYDLWNRILDQVAKP
ncbi:MAG: hypothetical protein AB7G21_00460 [Dehalococcoidia bacterium]